MNRLRLCGLVALLALLVGTKVYAWDCPFFASPYAYCADLRSASYCSETGPYDWWTECSTYCWSRDAEPFDTWCDDSESSSVLGCICDFS